MKLYRVLLSAVLASTLSVLGCGDDGGGGSNGVNASVLFLSGAAQEVIDDYCGEVATNVSDTVDELEEANRDLEECSDDLDDCLGGLFKKDVAQCIGDYGSCTTFGTNDQRQACQAFLNEFQRDTRRAQRQADRQDVEDEFLDWISGDTPSREECLQEALFTALLCVDQLIGD